MQPLLSIVALALVLVGIDSSPSNIGDKRVVCYFGSWAQYRYGNAKFNDQNVQCGLCTHFIYTFVGLDDYKADVKWLDAYGDIGDGDWKKEGLFQIIRRKCRKENTKFMAAIGGWNEGSEKYSNVVQNPQKRATLINNIYAFVREWDLDGFDLDWEYPNQRGGRPGDKEAFSELIRGLREKFDPEKLLLSAAVTANSKTYDLSYDVPFICKNLDFINIMAYDLHGSWDPVTGHHAALYKGPYDSQEDGHLNVLAAVQGWIDRGADPECLNMGMAAYGRSFTLDNKNNYGIGAPARGTAPAGWTDETGFIGYDEICYKNGTTWTTYYDETQRVPYAVSGTKWVGFDDVDSLREKVCVAKSLKLGGVMLWTVETDDFRGNCGRGQYPLLHSMLDSLADPTCGGPVSNGPSTQPPQLSTTARPSPPPQPTTTTVAPPAPTTPAPQPLPAPTTTTSTTTSAPIWSVSDTQTTSTQASNNVESIEQSNDPHALCKTSGEIVGDPYDQSKFYMCANGAGRVEAYSFTCPQNLYFDSSIKGCNWK